MHAMSVHPSAIVSDRASLGSDVVVGPFAIVEPDVTIGSGCVLGAHAVVRAGTWMGAANRVFEGAILGGEPQDFAFDGSATELRIGDRNVFREGVTVSRATQSGAATVIGSDCFMMANAHIAHNCRVGDRVIVANNVSLAGYVELGDRAYLSGGVVVHQFCRVGRLAMIGGNSKVVQDCLPFVITDGHPARARGLNVVGLRRAGMGAAQLRILKQAYRLLLRSGLPREEALARLQALGDPLVDEMIGFVRGSTRGIAAARRAGAPGDDQ